MRLQLRGVIETGDPLLDSGINDIKLAVVGGEIQIYASTGKNGGLAGYVIGADGTVTIKTSVIFPPEITLAVGNTLVFGDTDAGPILYLGSNGDGLLGYTLGPGGLVAVTVQPWDDAQALANSGLLASMEGLILLSENAPALFPLDFDCSQIVDLVSVTIDGQMFILTADAGSNQITALRLDAATGKLVEADTMGALQGLGLGAPTAMEVAQIGGQSYVIVAAAGTSSLSVLRLLPDGTLVPTDHLIDNATTRLEGVQDLAVAQSGDHVFVVAGGADNGLTLFLLLPDGTLVHLQTIADTDATSMHKVTAIEVVVVGDTLHVFVGSQNDAGVTEFVIDLSTLGALQTGTAVAEELRGAAGDDILIAVGPGDTLIGGAGADVLVTGGDGTRMTGGAGGDIFRITNGSGASIIADFEKSVDRLDLTGLPMLRDLSQLVVVTTATGARIEYRGHVITITSADGKPLTLLDLFPRGLEGGDHYIPDPPPLLGEGPTPQRPGPEPLDPEPRLFEMTPRDPVPPQGLVPGESLIGTDLRDTLNGTERDDTLRGLGGHDTILGGAGHDLIDGGDGRDVIHGGDGDDTIFGGVGRDVLYGDDGNDLIFGGIWGDTLVGGNGNDTLIADDGYDRLWGGAGDDVLLGGDGNNIIGGGSGDDWAHGGAGNDKIYGGGGSDTLFGGDGNDTIGGGGGDDYVDGADGDDMLFGKNGNDWMIGGTGNDTIWCGAGDDVAFGDGGNDLIRGVGGNDSLYGGAGRDAIWGDGGNDLIHGGADDDWLSGGDGNDVIFGDAGNDTLRGGTGIDALWGGAGADVFEFFGDHDVGWIMDFNPAEGDILRLDDAMWAALGTLTPQQVIDEFGYLDAEGNLILDFSQTGGAVIVLGDFSDSMGLVGNIEIM